MVGFLEKQLERQIMLICLLSMDMAEINDLAEELKVTDKTIIADIDNFNSSCFPAYIEVNQYKEVTLKIPSNLNLDDIFIKILNNSIYIEVLKYILISEPSLTEISAKLFLSKTSVRRIITKINTYFSKERLDIQIILTTRLQIILTTRLQIILTTRLQIILTTRLQIIGDEIYIRKFFSSMFKEICKEKDLPYFEMIYKMLKRCLIKQGRDASSSKIIYTVYYIFTSIIRIGNDHLIPKEELADRPAVVDSIMETIKSDTVFCTLINQNYKFVISRENIENILSPYLSLLFTNPAETDEYMLRRVELFLKHFYYLSNINETVTTEKVLHFTSFITFYKELTFFKVSYADIFYKKILKKKVQIWEAYQSALIISNLSSVRKNELLLKELLLELIVSSNELLHRVEPKLKERSILLLSSQEMGLPILYKNLILNKYPSFKKVDIYEKDVFSLDYTLINQYDLVLTDVNLKTFLHST
ncbi:helix-turn-helix domain-containing protein [Enterococcus lactis]|uniref:helix-turn-helix domain-containing protein n=1 Tax=Enterococcus lactis TaxID=357441 RepID=UPI00241219AB|nr:helix-turn-helix domain-containing protein [Enterococcus lactis]